MTATNQDWAPYELVRREEWLCRWFARAGQAYDEPFFSETVQKCLAHPTGGRRFESCCTLDYLPEAARRVDALPPSAFIFHVSRCGSTLLAQLLGLDPANVVLSEAPLIDSLLRLPLQDAQFDQAAIDPLLQSAIALLGDRRLGQTRLFVKLDSWHIHFAPQLRRLYPEVPFILLHRPPAAVIRSHQERRGMQAVPGLLEPQLFGLAPAELTPAKPDEYMTRVLAYYYTQFLSLAKQDRHTTLLDYRHGGEAMMCQLARQVGMVLEDADLEKIRARSRFHSKYPEQAFAEQREERAMPANLHLAELAYRDMSLFASSTPGKNAGQCRQVS